MAALKDLKECKKNLIIRTTIAKFVKFIFIPKTAMQRIGIVAVNVKCGDMSRASGVGMIRKFKFATNAKRIKTENTEQTELFLYLLRLN